jgi:hypothetical protein
MQNVRTGNAVEVVQVQQVIRGLQALPCCADRGIHLPVVEITRTTRLQRDGVASRATTETTNEVGP